MKKEDVIKLLEENDSDLNHGNVRYLGDWSYETFGYSMLYLIELVKIRPVYKNIKDVS